MKNLKKVLLTFIFGLLLLVPNVNAEDVKNEVKLNFKGGTIHDGYVEYSEIGKIQLFKNDELVIDISNNMVIDLNEAEYKFVIKEIETEDSTSPFGPSPVRLKINNWYYVINNDSFKLDTNNFSGDLNVELERKRVAFNIEVKNTYNDIKSTGVIDLTNGKEYVIDFSKTDELTEGLKSFADLDKTLYYQMFNESLLVTDDESVAVIKIVGNRKENKAILTAVNVGDKKGDIFKGLHTKYTGSALHYDNLDGDITSGGIILETRTDYYTRCKYDFIFRYDNQYKVIEGANQTLRINRIKDLIIKIDASFDLFKTNGKVYINDELLDENNYTSKEGSTIITLKEDYLKTLSKGTYTLKIVFNDDRYATTNFFIEEEIKNPETSDNFNNYIIISITSLLLGGVLVYNKKKLFEN